MYNSNIKDADAQLLTFNERMPIFIGPFGITGLQCFYRIFYVTLVDLFSLAIFTQQAITKWLPTTHKIPKLAHKNVLTQHYPIFCRHNNPNEYMTMRAPIQRFITIIFVPIARTH